jgi:ppGpp synthetase/RelA/SpoT-type nucleotidyltranferase
MIPKWKPTAIKVGRQFLYEYSQEFGGLIASAKLAEDLIRSILKPSHLEIHQVAARVKGLDSMRLKLRRKHYSHPERDVLDKIGVRVITYYMDDVDRVAELLKLEFEIDSANSEDKRTTLETSAFGYRSVHLIARLQGSRLASPEYSSLRGRWFEIQVRSLLEHAWAEIEHEVKYKPRVDYPSEITRRFARIAGVLEFLDTEFLALRRERLGLITTYRDLYLRGKDYDVSFDSARLLGFLEAARPQGLSWRRASSDGRPFPLHVEASCVDALSALGVDTPRKLRRALGHQKVRRKLARFAEVAGVDPSEVSHLAVILVLVLTLSPARLADLFPQEVCNSSELREMRSSN